MNVGNNWFKYEIILVELSLHSTTENVHLVIYWSTFTDTLGS